MKKIVSYLLVLFICYGTMTAQVNIGNANDPHSGAVLDLSQTEEELGLLLPKVQLSSPKVFQLVDSDANDFDQLKTKAVGMCVYNTRVSQEDGLEEGLYVWNGAQWNTVSDNVARNMKAKDPLPKFDFEGKVKDGISALVSLEDPSAAGSYTFAMIAGKNYASVTPEHSGNAAFAVSFTENHTGSIREAIVLVTNSAGKSVPFVFSQDANTALCTNSGSMDLKIKSMGTLGKDGAVYLNVANPESQVNYVWTCNNVEVGIGTSLTVTQAGIYAVHGGSIGCGPKDEITVRLDRTQIAPSAVTVTTGNSSVLCGPSKRMLYAIDVSDYALNSEVIWIKDGEVTNQTGRSVGISEAGNWFAVIKYGDCYSKPSNIVTITENPASNSIRLNLENVKVNSTLMENAYHFYKGGSLFLSIENPDPNISYLWYNGDDLITTNPYVVPTILDSFFLRVIAIDNTGQLCPDEYGIRLKVTYP
ncbi:MAG: hypothetical protein EZS26_002430 [Candidatus Ordinivivax streblomastigis]|uniref:Ig-like domain-containing protein n=1 Tax=Candidatus Ordinivivax streblomastigis TaxID=2540710 RepID=A0A5M8NZ66_9BACT|nr:MAG: hypothetical protein EZS26_002430 [Candidatus Ordinivivax streblomastigis]